MVLFLIIYPLSLLPISLSLQCPFTACPRSYLGDRFCDLSCNNILCNFDSGVFSDEISNSELFSTSDCFISCLSQGCTEELLSNDQCDEVCNNIKCAFDLGNCGICASGCTLEELLNEKCDESSPCNVVNCEYDLKECNICVEGCGKTDIFKETCENDLCRNEKCYQVKGNPCSDHCSSNCLLSQVNNGVCDESCFLDFCDFDGNDCLCSEGCTKEELGTECKGFSDPCNNERCRFKNGKCGSCASGCFDSMIGDSICNKECLNSQCHFDYSDCSCSSGCFQYLQGNQFIIARKSENVESCFVADCWFNIQDSEDDFIRRSRILSTLMYKNFNFFDVGQLPDGCSESDLKFFDALDGLKCEVTSPCYSPGALWCMGRGDNNIQNCLRASNESCVVFKGFMVNNENFSDIESCPESTEMNKNLSQLFSKDSEVTWCTISTIGTGNNPEVIFVNSSAEPQVSGDGSYENPFLSLYQAFIKVSRTFTNIKLFPGDFIYQFDSNVKFQESSIFSPLSSSDSQTLIIESIDSINPSRIYWSEAFSFGSETDLLKISWKGRIIIKNIEFHGENILKKGCELGNEECLYCPFFTMYYGEYFEIHVVNDKYQEYSIDLSLDLFTQMKKCEIYESSEFFVFHGPATLINVTFQSFRNKFKSLIKSFSSLELENVNFFKVQPSGKGVVIDVSCISSCESINFSFNKGNVEDMTYGYEINEDLKSGGFLKINDIHSIKLFQVKFQFNIAYSSPSSFLSTSFISVTNFLGSVLIDDCLFLNLYVNTLISIDTSSLVYKNLVKDDEGNSVAYNQLHFQLSNSKFKNVYTSTNFIKYFTQQTTQNVKIFNVEFFSVCAAGSSIISLIFDGILKKIDTFGEIIKVNEVTASINKRIIEMEELRFFGVSTGEFVILVKRNPNVYLKDIKVAYLYDGSRDSVSVIVDEFRREKKYFTIVPRTDQIGDLKCSGSIKIEECFNVESNLVYSEENDCYDRYSSSGLIFEKITGNLTLISTIFLNIYSACTFGCILLFNEIKVQINIQNTSIDFVYNPDGTLIEFYKCDQIFIQDFKVSQLNVNISSPITIIDFTSFTIIDSILKNINNYYGDCGFLMFQASGSTESTINITSSTLEDIYVYGNSGLFMIDSLSGSQSHNIYIKNVTFQRVSAAHGIFLYVSKKIKIKDSLISEIRGSFNYDSISMIYDSHSGGILKLFDVEFTFNDNIDFLGVLAEYQGEGDQLELSHFRVIHSTRVDQVFQITGKNIEVVTLRFYRIFVKNITSYIDNQLGKTMKINAVTLRIEDIDVSFMAVAAEIVNAGLVINNGDFSNLKESFINVQSQGFFLCSWCNIYDNFAALFSVTGESFIQINDSNIFNNTYQGSGCTLFEIDSLGNEKNVILRTLIKDNKSIGSKLVELSITNFYLIDSFYINNIAGFSAFPGIVAFGTDLYLINTTFSRDLGEPYSPLVYSGLYGYLTAINSRFLNGNSKVHGGAIAVVECQRLVITGCTFKNNTSLENGGALYSTRTKTTISNSYFEGNSAKSGSDLHLSENNYSILNSSFFESKLLSTKETFSLEVSGNSLLIDQVNIKNLELSISAVSCIGLKEVTIKNTWISGIKGRKFGSVYFEGGSLNGTVIINNSTFENNSCQNNGGAIVVSDMNLVVNNSLISYNEALLDGGGIFYQSPNCRSCKFNITGNTRIQENKAGKNGGALRWLNFKPNIDSSVDISNNSAESGSNVASVPAFLGLRNRRLGQKTSDGFDYSLENIAPGQMVNYSIILYIYDSEGNVITTENSSEISLVSTDENLIITGKKTFKSISGKFNITGFILRGFPGSSVSFNATTNSISKKNVENDDFEYRNSFTISTTLRTCKFGEASDSDACLVCPEGKYLIKTEASCKSCPEGGICPGGSAIWVKPGYYRTTNESEVLYRCSFEESCSGNDKDYRTECYKGYTGITCNVCDKGYTKASDGKCSKCPGNILNYFILIFIIIAFFIISAILVHTTISSAFAAKAKHSIYIKIFTNYLQLVFLTSEFDLAWPNYVVELFGAQKTAASASEVAFSVDCYEENDGNFYESIYYKKMILYSMLPIIIVLLSSLAWAMISWLNRSKNVFKRELPLTIIIVYFLIHPNLVKFMFSNFSCQEFDQIGSYLTSNYAIKCWTTIHIKYSLYLSLPSIIIWSLGIPSLVLIRMIKQRKHLHHDKNKVMYGFLCNGYRTSKFYWEFMIIYRKIIIICIIVFLGQVSNDVQALTVTIVLLLAIFLQYRLHPYNSIELNHMEMEALITATLTIYCGLYYLTGDIGEAVKLILFGLIILGNCYFIFTWFYWMCLAVADAIVKIIPNLKHFCKKGDAFDEDFNTEKIGIPKTFYDESDGARKFTFINYDDTTFSNFNVQSMKHLFFYVFKDSIDNRRTSHLDSRYEHFRNKKKSSNFQISEIPEEDYSIECSSAEENLNEFLNDSLSSVEKSEDKSRNSYFQCNPRSNSSSSGILRSSSSIYNKGKNSKDEDEFENSIARIITESDDNNGFILSESEDN